MDRTTAQLVSTCHFALLISCDARWTRHLLLQGVNKDQKDVYGASPLHLAARRGDLEMCIVLVDHGFKIEELGCNGW